MLILMRREGERLVVTLPDGRTVAVEVKEIRSRSKQVRLAIYADRDIPVFRKELLDKQATLS